MSAPVEDLDLETSFITFAEETLGLDLYDWQAEAVEAFDHMGEGLVQVTLATPNGSGKSSVVIPTLILGHLAMYPKGRVVLTSADSKQLDGQIMPAINTHRVKFPGWRFLSREIITPTGGQFVAFTTDEAGRAEGWHKLDDVEGPLLVIIDEAKSVPEAIFSAIDRCTYNGIMLASSPGKMDGTFYESQHNPALGYHRLAIGLKDCPHITQDKIDRIIAKHGANSPFTRSSLHGEYIEYFAGEPVYYAYNMAIHEAKGLEWPEGAYLCRGYDWGTNNYVVWCAYWRFEGCEYIHAMMEQYREGSDTDRQIRECVTNTANEFPFWNDRNICSGLMDFCDPAGASSSFTRKIEVNGKQVDESAINIARTHGIYPSYMTSSRGLQETIAIVNRLLEKRDRKGRPCFRIDTDACPKLTRALRGAYRYPDETESGYGRDLPLKGLACDNADHPADGFRYLCINVLKLLRAEMEPKKPPLFANRKKPSLNPRRKI